MEDLTFMEDLAFDSAMPSLIEHWRRQQWAGMTAAAIDTLTWTDEVAVQVANVNAPAIASLPDVLIQAAVVRFREKVPEGQLIAGVAIPWFEIIAQLERDAGFLFKIPWRKLEELIAGAYEREGWPEVVLTPRSGDGGRDVIASKPGFGSIRIVDQVKAYAPGHLVTADEIRSMLGVLQAELNVSKGLVTTTSGFAPRIAEDDRLKVFIPYRLELRGGVALTNWLVDLKKKSGKD